ncbi:hypothetical protein [Salinispora vitiensis]|uniref:hypothetical protein n=1 Tax=Salinispora vitiensis TaxID=999544 RepID=UPI0004783E27|nr:hypothetical protein [Salinispora vitiensis]
MAYRRVGAVLTAAVLIAFTTAGCLGKDSAMQPTETLAQAAERVEEILQEAIAQLPSDATIDRRPNLDGVPCDLSTGPVFSERSAQVIPPVSGTWSETDVLSILSEFWERRGYTAFIDENSSNQHRYFVRTDDGYKLSVRTYDRGGHYDVRLGASSPCVWEFGTPGPQ